MIQQMFILADGTSLLIREANFNDAVFLNQLAAAIFASTDQVLTTLEEFKSSSTVNAQLKRIENYMNGTGKLLLVAEVGGKLVGTLDFWNGNRKRIQHTGEFGMGVVSDFRNKGVGGYMLQVLLDWAKNNPIIEKIKLGVFASNGRAIHLYQKMGFVEEGRSISEIKTEDGLYCDVITMYQWLK